MYENMLKEDLSELIEEYCKLDWKKRSEAAKILGYIKDPNEINKLTPCIIELALDNNRITKINLINSIKKIILEYNIINEELFVLLYVWANSQNTLLLEMAKSIISSLSMTTISEYILSLSLKLYSSKPIEVMYAMVAMGMISLANPEYIINTLPEIIMIANEHEYVVIQMSAIDILEEFRNIGEDHLINNFARIYKIYSYYTYKNNNFDIESKIKEEDNDYLLYVYFKNHLTKDEIKNLAYKLIYHESNDKRNYKIYEKIIFTSLIMHTHFNLLKELLMENEALSKDLLKEVLKNFENNNFMVKLSTILLFSKLVSVENVFKYLTREDIDKFFKVIKNNLIKSNYILKGYSLKALNNLLEWGGSQYILEKIEQVLNEIDLERVMNEGYLCYYNGTCLLLKLDKDNYPSTRSSPYFDENTIKELSSLNIDDYRNLLLNIKTSVKRSFWIGGWLDRFYSGKYLGNILHLRPGYVTNVLDSINSLILDNNFIVRSVGIWALRISAELKASFSEDFILKSMIIFDDTFYECRLEYILFWKTILEKSPNLLNNENISKEIAYEMISKYLNDRCETLRDVYLDMLSRCGIIQKYPELNIFKNYHDLSKEDRKSLFIEHWKNRELRKAIAISIKLKLKEAIKNKNYDIIKEYLEIVSKMEIHREIFYILYELILLKNNEGFKEAEDLINNIRYRHPTIPYYLEQKLFYNINEPLVNIRKYKLKRLLAVFKENFYISYDLLNKVKEIAIYEHICKENINMALEILVGIKENESKSIANEKLELMKYIEKIPPVYYKKSLKDMNWKDICILIYYLPTEGKLKIFENYDPKEVLDKVMDILENEDKVIVKVKILDLLINEIHENEELLNMILNNKKSFKIFYNLYSDNRSLLFKKVVLLLGELSSLDDEWLEKNIIEYYKDDNNKRPLKYLLHILYEDVPLYFKLSMLKAVKGLTEDRNCKKSCTYIREMLREGKLTKEEIISKYGDVIGIHTITSDNNILCQNMDNIALIVNAIFNRDMEKQPWIIVKYALDILVLMCEYVLSDEYIIEVIIKRLLEYYDVLKDKDEKYYLYIYLKKLLEICKYNLEKLGEKYLEKYMELEYEYIHL